jgi:hypothetical protein
MYRLALPAAYSFVEILMRLRLSLLVTALAVGSVTAGSAQRPPDTRSRVWTYDYWFPRRPIADLHRFRTSLDRTQMVQRALERAERTRSVALERARSRVERAARLRDRASQRSFERLDRVRDRELTMRDREFAMRDRLSDRLRTNPRRNQEIRERTMERVRERMARLRDEHRFMIRRRSRTI